MSSYLPYIINWLQLYGYPVLWLSVFIAAVGLPLPTTLLLLAAGAFAALGNFNLLILIPLAISASTLGDNVGYLLGRRFGSLLLHRLERQQRLRFIPTHNIAKARAYFTRRGGWAIFLTRFLFSALGGITNILAGADIYPYKRFLLYDICGETIGATTLLLLGFTFGASWEAVGDMLGTFSGLLLACTIAIALSVLLIRNLHAWSGRDKSVPTLNWMRGCDKSVPTHGRDILVAEPTQRQTVQSKHTGQERMTSPNALSQSQRPGTDSLPL